MGSRTASLALLCAASIATCAACGMILGYDELNARSPESDTGPADTAVADTAPEIEPPIDAGAGYRPQPRPKGDPKPSGTGKTLWLIMKQVQLGTLDATGKGSSDAWRDLGFDLDGRCTGTTQSADDVDTCKKVEGAAPDMLVDGNSCRDNNFCGRLMQLIKFARFEEETNLALSKGNNAWILRLDDLDPGEDDPYVPGRLYKAADWPTYPAGPPPKFDGTDVRKVTSDSVIGDDLEKCRTTFAKGYLSKGQWVSGEPMALSVTLPLDAVDLAMPLEGVVMTVELSKDHSTGGAGTLGGALPVTAAEPLMRPIAKSIGVCPGTAVYAAAIDAVNKAPDVVMGAPSLQDPTKTCNGVSVGIGFAMTTIQPVTEVVAEKPPTSDKCGDSGP